MASGAAHEQALDECFSVLTLLLLEFGFGASALVPFFSSFHLVLTLLLLEFGFGVRLGTPSCVVRRVLTLLLLEFGFGAYKIIP